MGSCAWEKTHPTPDLTPLALAAWELYQLSQTQWNVGMSGATGLRYEGVEACARLHGLEVTPRVFRLFRMFEAKRLSIWHEEREAARKAAERKK